MIQRLICLLGSLSEIFEERLQFLADGVYVLQSCLDLRPVFFEHSARICEFCGKIRAVLRTEQIVHARDRLFPLRRSIARVNDLLGPQNRANLSATLANT